MNEKIQSYEESFNKLRTFTSADLLQRFSSTAQGEIAGIGGSVTSTTEARLHTEIETEKFNRKRSERIIEDDVTIEYPGPLLSPNGYVIEEGNIWLIKRSVQTIQTITPMTAYGIWDSPIEAERL